MTAVREAYAAAADAVIVAVITAHVWGPVLLALLVVGSAAAWWHRPSGRHRTLARTPARTPVRDGVRPTADTAPTLTATAPLTCTDTRPDVSVDTRPGVSGHKEKETA
ncbi:hypothetical protein ACFV1C_00440 [Streptomyces sp. NPDC059605]|uniref:hypothetical protein n=1 Tax=Streptomyces sp. NPDC059605 TaxID=3346882 RepID=UPI00368C5B5B